MTKPTIGDTLDQDRSFTRADVFNSFLESFIDIDNVISCLLYTSASFLSLVHKQHNLFLTIRPIQKMCIRDRSWEKLERLNKLSKTYKPLDTLEFEIQRLLRRGTDGKL